MYSKTKRLFDIDNVTSVHKKYFQDALVELGVLDDDNFETIPTSSESFGGQSKGRPRVDAYIICHGSDSHSIFDKFLKTFSQ